MLEELYRILAKTVDEKYNLVRCLIPDPDPETNIQPPFTYLKIWTNDKEICRIEVKNNYLEVRFSACMLTITIDMGNQAEDPIKMICDGIEKWSDLTMIPIRGPFLEEPPKIKYKMRNPWY